MKKKVLIGSGIITVFVIAVIVFVLYQSRFEMSINHQKVSKDEYLYILNSQIYDVTQELSENNNVQINAEFWEKEINGKIPYEVLADATMEQLKYNRAVYETAKELGYVDEVDYESIVKRMEAENESRAQKISKGEPVYGLSEFTIQLFMEYEMDTFQKSYCNDLSNEGMEVTEQERQEYYEAKKDSIFTKEDDMTFDYIKISYEAEGMSLEEAKEFENALVLLYKELDNTTSLSELAAKNSMLSPYLVHEEILSSELNAKYRTISDIIDYGYELEKGEVSQVIDESGCLYLIQCSDRVEYNYVPIEEVKDYINQELREQHYEEVIAKKAEEATLEADENSIYYFTKKYIN